MKTMSLKAILLRLAIFGAIIVALPYIWGSQLLQYGKPWTGLVLFVLFTAAVLRYLLSLAAEHEEQAQKEDRPD